MWPYWLMFAVPALVELFRPPSARPHPWNAGDGVAWTAAGIALTLLIGFRYEVGGDWLNYLDILENLRGASLHDVLAMGDPTYMLLNWLSLTLDMGIFGVNVVCGTVFTLGLLTFCRSLPRPWLALTIAVPYLVMVVAMGYSRQGLAIGLIMLGLSALARGRNLAFASWTLLAATCHKSAIVMLPIAALAATRKRHWTAIWVGVACVLGYQLLLERSVGTLYANYVEARYQSQGALVRLLMNALPAGFLLVRRSGFASMGQSVKLWLWMAAVSVVLLGLYFVTPATTAIDRIALYMLPLQLAVFAHLPDALLNTKRAEKLVTVPVVLYYVAVQFVWLNFGAYSYAWIPYQFYPFAG